MSDCLSSTVILLLLPTLLSGLLSGFATEAYFTSCWLVRFDDGLITIFLSELLPPYASGFARSTEAESSNLAGDSCLFAVLTTGLFTKSGFTLTFS